MEQFSVFFKNFDNIKNILIDNSYSFYLYDYYPKKYGTTDKISKYLLDLKENDSFVDFFYEKLSNILSANFVITIVPSSTAGIKSSPFITLANKVIKSNQLIDGIFCLERIKTIDKLAYGGSRDESVHLNSIALKNQDLITNKNVLILDDIRTTGNSLNACEKILKRAKPKLIAKFSFAQTV